jgi:type VI secretion system protein ImpK
MSATAARPSAGSRLPQLCSELFAFALSLRTAQDPGEALPLFDTAARLLEQMSRRARDAGVDSAHLEAARYALCALIDEVVLGSRWAIKAQWMQQPLQMAYFQDFTAGEQFYRRLDELRRDQAHNSEPIEVYALCLAAGFRGKHADLSGMQKVDDLLAELGKAIREQRGVTSRALSPPPSPAAVLPQAVRRVPVWIAVAAGAGLLLVLLFALDALLSSQAAPFLDSGRTGR